MSTEHSCNTAPLQTGRCAKTCAKCAQLLKKQGIPFRLPFARPVYCLNISMHNRRKNGFNNCLCAAINSYYVNRFACFFVEKIRIISFTDESCMLFNVFSLAVQKRPFVELTNGLSVSKNPFRHAGRLLKSSEDKQLTPVGVHRYGRA